MTILRNQIILGFAVVVATEATNSSHVVAGQSYKHSASPVEGDLEAKVCVDIGVPATAIRRHLSSIQGDRQVDQLIVYLGEDTIMIFI